MMWQILFFALPPQIKAPQIKSSQNKSYQMHEINDNKHYKNKEHKIKFYNQPINRKHPKQYKIY